MSKVIRFRAAMFLCYISRFIFPKCTFKKNLEKLMLNQANHFAFRNKIFGDTLKNILEEQNYD